MEIVIYTDPKGKVKLTVSGNGSNTPKQVARAYVETAYYITNPSELDKPKVIKTRKAKASKAPAVVNKSEEENK
jgi:hypothetical protein